MIQGIVLKHPAFNKSPHNRALCALSLGLGFSEERVDVLVDDDASLIADFKEWKAKFDEFYSKKKNASTNIHDGFGRLGTQAVLLLYKLYSRKTDADRALFLAKAFERAAKKAAIDEFCGFFVWNLQIQCSIQIDICKESGCKMMYAVFCAIKKISAAFEQTKIGEERASESEAVVRVQHRVATHLHETLDPIVDIEVGGRSSAMFGVFAAISGIPIMPNGRGSKAKSTYRSSDDTKNVMTWAAHISSSFQDLWEIASKVIDGKVDATRLTSARTRCIYVLQYFARMFTISLAATGHMRPECWYNLYMSAVFGVDGDEDGTGLAKMAAASPEVEVPAAEGLRDIVWNLNLMLKAHSNAFAAKEACLSWCAQRSSYLSRWSMTISVQAMASPWRSWCNTQRGSVFRAATVVHASTHTCHAGSSPNSLHSQVYTEVCDRIVVMNQQLARFEIADSYELLIRVHSCPS
jgi:hypothetical protein